MVSLIILGGAGAGVAWRRAAEVDSAAERRIATGAFEDGPALSRTRGRFVAALNEHSIVQFSATDVGRTEQRRPRPACKYPPVSFRPMNEDALTYRHVTPTRGSLSPRYGLHMYHLVAGLYGRQPCTHFSGIYQET